MGKQVTHAAQFRDPRQHVIGNAPERLLFVLVCDDGSAYEFQKMSDSKIWKIRARGNVGKPRSRWTQSRAPLPSDVTETLNEKFGETNWTK